MERSARRPVASLLALPAYLIVTVIVVLPLLPRFGSGIPSPGWPFDPPLQAFLIGWDWHALTTAPGTVFDVPMFYPEPRALTYMDSMLGETVAASPILAAHGSIAAAYNFLILLSFALSAWGAYRLTRLFHVSRAGAFLSGLLFAFCPYRFANLALLNQLQTQLLVWGLFFAVRYVLRKRLRDVVGSLAMLVTQVYYGWYYAYYLLIAIVLTIVYSRVLGIGTRCARHSGPALGLAAAAAIVAVVPIAWPYTQQHMATPGYHRTLGEAALYSADLLDYFRTNPGLPGARLPWMPSGPQSYWPGFFAVALGLVGAYSVWKQRDGLSGLPVALAAVGWVLSLGPILHVAGRTIPVPLPYGLLYFMVPGISGMRAPARLAVLVALGMAVLAGIGYERVKSVFRSRATVRVGTIALAWAIVAGALYRPVTWLDLPRGETIPSIYRHVAAGHGALLELPVPATDGDESATHALRQFAVLYHGMPRLDGVSGFVSPRYREFRRVIQSFPNDAALAAAYSLGARSIIVHYGDYTETTRADLARRVTLSRRLSLVAREGNDALYILEP